MSAPALAERPMLELIEGGGGRRRTLWCQSLPGFGLRLYASGRSSYIVQTRMGGRLRVVTIGRAALLSEHQARDLARHILLRAQTGENPADERKRCRAAPAFSAYLDEYWRRIAGRWKASTRVAHDIYRRNHLDRAFRGMTIDAIGHADVQRWFVDLSDSGGPGAANRTLEILSGMFGRAEAWGYRPEGSNPCRGLRKNRPRRFPRVLEPAELSRLGRALDRRAETRPLHAAAIRLLLLTGCRLSEILSLEWSDVRGAKVQLRDAKTGPRTVWLGDEAKATFAAIPRTNGQDAVFHDPMRRRPIRYLTYDWSEVLKDASVPPTRLHDLRHTFASYAARGSETMPMIGRLLGHRRMASTARYAKLDDLTLIDAAERIGMTIATHSGLS